MPLYNLSEQQAGNIQQLIARCQIKGSEALVVLDLQRALSSPINPGVIAGKKGEPKPPPPPIPSDLVPSDTKDDLKIEE